jgi:hypothetical protein
LLVSLDLHPVATPNTPLANATVINQPHIRLMQSLSHVLLRTITEFHALKAT